MAADNASRRGSVTEPSWYRECFPLFTFQTLERRETYPAERSASSTSLGGRQSIGHETERFVGQRFRLAERCQRKTGSNRWHARNSQADELLRGALYVSATQATTGSRFEPLHAPKGMSTAANRNEKLRETHKPGITRNTSGELQRAQAGNCKKQKRGITKSKDEKLRGAEAANYENCRNEKIFVLKATFLHS